MSTRLVFIFGLPPGNSGFYSEAVVITTSKSDTYRAMGVREMCLVDTEKKEIEVRSFEADKSAVFKIADTLRSEVLPTIEIPVTLLFPQ